MKHSGFFLLCLLCAAPLKAAEVTPCERWEYLGEWPMGRRSFHSVVWTGAEMIVWGGDTSEAGFVNNGGCYNPRTKQWRMTSTRDAPSPRNGHSAVWAPEIGKMLVWGGVGFAWYNDGGIYDPLTDTWTPIPPAPIAGLAAHTAVWTGSEMIVWGGETLLSVSREGAAYNPAANAWRALPIQGAPGRRIFHSAVWTGIEMIVFGGDCQGDSSSCPGTGQRFQMSGSEIIFYNDGGAYNPETNSWRPLSLQNAPMGRNHHTAVWTGGGSPASGGEMIVWGGTTIFDYNPYPYAECCDYPQGGGRYNPEADVWSPINLEGAPEARRFHAAFWAPWLGGGEMLVWGGEGHPYDCSEPGCLGYNVYFNDGGRYDPEADAWLSMTVENAPEERTYMTAAWTGMEMLVFSGANDSAHFKDGGAWIPETREDVNGDGMVDFRDLNIVRMNLGRLPASPLYDPDADVNGDGVINRTDRQLVEARLGQRACPAEKTSSTSTSTFSSSWPSR